jgi:NAD(P)-dependent dehydrogenase (short-subunit alcohol dehydrogenase family)
VTWSVGSGLDGKGVIVTGAAGGIGRAVASAFAEAGARVLATDLEQAAVDEVVGELAGRGHLGIATDLRDLASHGALVGAARDAFGGVYVLAHLAAVAVRRYALDDVTEADWDTQLDINLKASFFLCRATGAAMIAQGEGGRIITFASQAWWTGGFAGATLYAASKGGVVSMSRGLARTLAPHGITVNTVAPGIVNTPMMTTDIDSARFDELTRQIPLGRVAEPADIAGVVVFLASDHARYITGATLNVSGGMLLY